MPYFSSKIGPSQFLLQLRMSPGRRMAREWLPQVTSGMGPQDATEADAVKVTISYLTAQYSV